jgi:hypothetical protein
VLVDGVDVALLVERLGPDGLAAARDDVEAEHLGRGSVAGGEHADGAADGVGSDLLAAGGELHELGEDAFGERDVGGGAGQGDLVAAHVHVGGEEFLGDAQVLVAGAEQAEGGGVGDGEPGLGRLGGGVLGLGDVPGDVGSGGSTRYGSGHVASALLSR